MTLKELFSNVANAIRNKKGTTNKIKPENFASEIESIESGGATITASGWQGTTVPNSGYVENVYFNTNLSADEVVEIIENSGLEFYEDSAYFIICGSDKPLIILNEGPLYLIADAAFDEMFFVSELPPDVENPFGFTGWNPDFSGSVSINSEVVMEVENRPTGIQNELITSLISTTPFVKAEQITLSGEYDGSSIEITENGSLDVKALIENKQIPLSVNVNVESSGNIIEVTVLPTENIQQNVIYQVNEVSDVDVLVWYGEGYRRATFKELVMTLGAKPDISYYLVDSLPETPNISDLATLSIFHIYIHEDIPFIYGNAGYGNMWLELKDLLNSASELIVENKGYIQALELIAEPGLYVTYKLGKYGVAKNKYELYKSEDNEWIDYEKIFNKSITTFSNSTITRIPEYSFTYCDKLENIYIPNAKEIGDFAFRCCYNLKNVNLPSVLKICYEAFSSNETGESIYIPNIKELEHHAISFWKVLKCVIITQTDTVCALTGEAFDGCYHILGTTDATFNPNGDQDGYVYVPDSMVEQYKVATNWTVVASQIKGLSELPQQYKDLYGI